MTDHDLAAALARVRQLRAEHDCTCKVGAHERIARFAPGCPWHNPARDGNR